MIHLGVDARLAMLDVLLGRQAFGGLTLKLFISDTESEDAELASDYLELEGHGYADAALDPDQWITTPGEVGEPALAVYPKITWTFKAGPAVGVFGYYVLHTDDQRLAWSERFVRPQIVEFSGDNISVVPTFRLRAMESPMLPAIQDGVGA